MQLCKIKKGRTHNVIIIIINGATAQSQALASLTGFMTVYYDVGYQPHDQPGSSHPDSTTRHLVVKPP
jgi:hypothetical protein